MVPHDSVCMAVFAYFRWFCSAGPVDGQDPTIRGDEQEVVSEESHHEDDEEERIPDDFYYNFDDHVSTAIVEEESGLPLNLLQLQYPYTSRFLWGGGDVGADEIMARSRRTCT